MKRRSQPPGFRFQPTHVELVMFYLKRRLMRKKLDTEVISELDIYKYEPWDLPDKSCWKSGDLKWYFFCPIKRKYGRGTRVERATEFGFWKSTGRDLSIYYKNEVVGYRKSLTFFKGKAPEAVPTNWVLHEYRIEEKSLKNVVQDAYVLCVIFEKNGRGPKNGAQYGAPFKEEDYDSDDDGSEEVDISSGPSVLPSKEPPNSFAPDTFTTPSNIFGCSSASCISENLPSNSKEIPQIASESIAPVEIPQNLDDVDDGITMEELFREDGNSNLNDGDGFQANVAASNNTNQDDTIYEGLGDIGGRSDALNGDGNAYITGNEMIFSSEQMSLIYEEMLSSDPMSFFELNDLETPLSSFDVVNDQDLQISNLNAAYKRSSVIEQPSFPFSSFGAANQHIPYGHYPSLHNSNEQICRPTDLGYPVVDTSAFSQSVWLQENIPPNSNGGIRDVSNGYKAPWSDHAWNPP